MTEEKLVFASRDMKNKIHARMWIPSEEVRVVLIVVHGMCEHIGRYEEMAEYLCSQGFLVAGADHLGHGATGEAQGEFGYFTGQDGATVLVRDVHRLKKMVQEKYPGVPVFIFGHSMGALIVRNYICRYGTGIRGAILMGNIDKPMWFCAISKLFIRVIAVFKGWHYISPTVTRMALFHNTKGPGRFPMLCHSEEVMKKHSEDEYCGFDLKINGYYVVSEIMRRNRDKTFLEKIPVNLPILMLDGGEDQFGDYGAAPKRIKELLLRVGLKDVRDKIYPEDAHEVYNEEDRYDAFNEIIKFAEGFI